MLFSHLMSGSLLVDILSDVVSNDVQLLLSVLGDDSGPLFLARLLILGEDTELFQSLERPSDDFTSTSLVVSSSDSVSFVRTVDVLQGSDTDVSSQIDLSSDRG